MITGWRRRVSSEPKCTVCNTKAGVPILRVGTRNFRIDVANVYTFSWILFISFHFTAQSPWMLSLDKELSVLNQPWFTIPVTSCRNIRLENWTSLEKVEVIGLFQNNGGWGGNNKKNPKPTRAADTEETYSRIYKFTTSCIKQLNSQFQGHFMSWYKEIFFKVSKIALRFSLKEKNSPQTSLSMNPLPHTLPDKQELRKVPWTGTARSATPQPCKILVLRKDTTNTPKPKRYTDLFYDSL